MIYVAELDNFADRIVFDVSREQLRMPGLTEEQHLWLADTNPSEEGTESWIWKLFAVERLMENHPEPEFQKHLHMVEFDIDDNLAMTPAQKAEMRGSYMHDKDLLDRYYYGKWKASSHNSHFADVFRSDVHVIGNAEAKDESLWEVIPPTDNCVDLVTGFDLGSGRNHSAHILEPIDMGGKTGFSVLDELIEVGRMVNIVDFTLKFMEKMERLENYVLREFGRKVRWRHWSDSSAFVFRSASDRAQCFDHLIVLRTSDGKIQLRAAPKFPGSVRKRVDLTRRLLHENRLWVSANCKGTIDMFRLLRKGKAQTDFIADGSPHKHPFDSLSYPLISELVDEVAGFQMPEAQPKPSLTTTPA